MTSSHDPQSFSRIYPDAALRRSFNPDPAGHWYVLRTKPRQENRAQVNLKAWGLQTLLPQLPDRRQKSGRIGGACVSRPSRRDAIHALFPSYMFCRFHEAMFDKVKYTYGVANIVSFGGVPAVVDQVIIDELVARLDPGGFVAPLHANGAVAPEFKNGDKVLIESGPFKNFIGVFDQEMPGSDRVRILLDAVKFQSRVECGRGDVRKV